MAPRVRMSRRDLQRALVDAAVSGMAAGIASCGPAQHAQPPPILVVIPTPRPGPDVPPRDDEDRVGEPRRASRRRAADPNCCKGKNDCKGKGMCKMDTHDCKGKNECKGRGGCKPADCGVDTDDE